MRAKFFWISFGTFAVTIAIVVAVYDWYFTKERLRLVDQQLSALATGLLASEIQIAEIDQMDDLVSKVLEEDPRVIMVAVFDSKGQMLYRNPESKGMLGGHIPSLIPGTSSFPRRWRSVLLRRRAGCMNGLPCRRPDRSSALWISSPQEPRPAFLRMLRSRPTRRS